MLTERRRTALSKLLSLILRHQPGRFGITLSENGYTDLSELIAAVRRQQGWADINQAAIEEVVATSDKQRFEIEGDSIRARYGHSTKEAVTYPAVEPPAILYHGTSRRSLPMIREEGLRSMRRQYVHLSVDTGQALLVGRRHDHEPVILVVRAKEAHNDGVDFLYPGEGLYLSPAIPAQFLDFGDEIE
ncbi:MAG TPA: RNA 2'-phosphotransferase [Capsulimonadaceae bacterium]|nr:RNA 2'-phosphotransferase [Capsulimonadaceae bacterium]